MAASRTRFFNDRHRAHAKAVDEANRDYGAKAEAKRARVRKAIETDIKASQGDPLKAAILQVELLRLQGTDLSDTESARIRRSVAKAFSDTPPTAEAAEAFAVFALLSESIADDGERFAARMRALAAHRQYFGDVERQTGLWIALFEGDAGRARAADTARAFVTAAAATSSPRMRFEAELRILRHVPRDEAVFREAATAAAPTALAVAATPAERIADRDTCYSHFSDFSSEMTLATALGATEVDKKQFIKLAVNHLAHGMSFETHAQFVMQDLSLILAARLVDHDAFIAAMTTLGADYPPCQQHRRPPAICGLMQSAEVTIQMNQPPIGIALLQDAVRLAVEGGHDARVPLHARLRLAEVQWKNGQKSLAAADVLALDAAEVDRDADVPDAAVFHRLRAQLADTQLDPVAAAKSFGALVDLAIKDARNANEEADDEPSANAAAQTLVERHVAGQFCADCGGAIAEPAMRWLREGLVTRGLKPGPAATRLLLYLMLPSAAVTPAETTAFEKKFMLAWGREWKPLADKARQRLPRNSSESSLIRALAIASALPFESGTAPDRQAVDTVLRFIVETDENKGAALLEEDFYNVVYPAYAEEGTTERLEEILDGFARQLAAAGYHSAAELVLSKLASHLDLDPDGRSEANLAALANAKTRPAFWTSVHARLGARAAVDKDWQEANRELDIAMMVATSRLDDEWMVSGDRVGLLLSEMRPVLTQAAQARVNLTAAAPANERLHARAFEELQLAMLGDTAAGLQAAQRRRLTAEPGLGRLFAARDRATARLALLKAFDDAAGVLDATRREEERQQITYERDDAARAIEARLPVSETLASLRPLPLADARKLLREGEALLILHAGNDGIYGSLASRVGEPVTWRRSLAAGELDQRIRAVRKGLDPGLTLPTFDFREAHALTQIVLGPVLERLKDIRSLLVVADGALLSLPLAVLPLEMPATVPSAPQEFRKANVKWLGRSHAIAYLPTARALAGRNEPRLASRAKYGFAGIGNPVLAPATAQARRFDYSSVFQKGALADVELLRYQPSLPETESEIRAIARIAGGREDDIFVGARASEDEVRRNGLGDYRIIMFATHGLMGGELEGMSEPGLVLTPPAAATAANDGLLTASEIMELKLDADLVILSACNTAASDGRPRAEGFSGLTRAFLSAGARTAIVTHWSIPSIAAVSVTTRAVQEKERRPDIGWSEAMRRAFVAMIESEGPAEFAHPTSWGAFIAVGVEDAARLGR